MIPNYMLPELSLAAAVFKQPPPPCERRRDKLRTCGHWRRCRTEQMACAAFARYIVSRDGDGGCFELPRVPSREVWERLQEDHQARAKT